MVLTACESSRVTRSLLAVMLRIPPRRGCTPAVFFGLEVVSFFAPPEHPASSSRSTETRARSFRRSSTESPLACRAWLWLDPNRDWTEVGRVYHPLAWNGNTQPPAGIPPRMGTYWNRGPALGSLRRAGRSARHASPIAEL